MINMLTNNYSILSKKINEFCKSSDLKQYINKIDIPNSDQRLYILDRKYPYLIPSLKQKFSQTIEINEIFNKMKSDDFLRQFLFTNYHSFLENYTFSRTNEEFFKDPSGLYNVTKFGFAKSRDCCDDYYRSMFNFYRNNLNATYGSFYFDLNIVKPFKKIISCLGIDYDDKIDCISIPEDIIVDPKIQNFLLYLQHHNFYEDYITDKIKEKYPETVKYIKNPIILVNPHFINDSQGKRLEGYFELDGSLIIEKNNITLLECKNANKIQFDHVTNFLGKCFLFEKIYDCNIKKQLYSTGTNMIWKDIDKFDNLNLEIFEKYY